MSIHEQIIMVGRWTDFSTMWMITGGDKLISGAVNRTGAYVMSFH